MQRSTGLLVVTVLGLSATACGSGEPAKSTAGGAAPVSITVDCQPAKSAPKERQAWDDDVATFMKAHPGMTVEEHGPQPCYDPKTFGPKLAGGQMETVFVVPVTNYNDVIGQGQALDITPYTSEIKNWNDLRPDVRELVTKDGKVYGVPNVHYGVGLVYNRELFTKAGLDPEHPAQDVGRGPRGRQEDRRARRRLRRLRRVLRRQHRRLALHRRPSTGAAAAWSTDDGKKAAFNSPEGKAVLQNLHDMRWVDNSMGNKLLVGWESLMMAMGSGKVGMMLGAPDVVTDVVNKFKGSVDDYGITGFPEAKASLSGGEATCSTRRPHPPRPRRH